MYTVYIIYSQSIDKYYIGYTSLDVSERLKKHLAKHNGFTSKAKDWVLVFSEKFELKIKAMNREKYLKTLKSRKVIANLIAGSEHPD